MTSFGAVSRTLPTLEVSRSALLANLQLVHEGCPGPVVPSISNDAIGLGAEFVRELAESVRLGWPGSDGAGSLARSTGAVIFAAITPMRMIAGLDLGFRPTVRLVGEVLGVKELRAGEGVSYGYTHVASADTRVALVTGGYAQGIVRSLGNSLTVAIGDSRYPIVGRVAMDVCVVDVGSAAIDRGDRVVFLGDPDRGEPSIAEWMQITGMQAEELVAPLGLRARREVVA